MPPHVALTKKGETRKTHYSRNPANSTTWLLGLLQCRYMIQRNVDRKTLLQVDI